MSDLSKLYQEVILDHSKRPRNFHPTRNADHHANGYNPLCGDKVTIYLTLVTLSPQRVIAIGVMISGIGWKFLGLPSVILNNFLIKS